MTEIWPGSRLSLGGEAVSGAPGTGATDPFVLAFLLLSALLVLVMFGRLTAAVRGSATFLRSSYATVETLENKYLYDSISSMFLLFLPFYAAAVRFARVGDSYWQTFLVLCALVLLRKAAMALLAWLKGSAAAFHLAERLGYGVFILVALASILPVPVLLITPFQYLSAFRIYLAIIALVGYAIYAARSFSLIYSTGFSSYYWVLYLCTLEILPVCVAVNYLLNGN